MPITDPFWQFSTTALADHCITVVSTKAHQESLNSLAKTVLQIHQTHHLLIVKTGETCDKISDSISIGSKTQWVTTAILIP